MWGTSEEGQGALRAPGLNYFLFSRELDIRDPLPLSPLFSPDNIARYFGIRWTDGTTTLLTWPDSDTVAPDAAWVNEYRRAVTQSSFAQGFPNAAMKAIFDRLIASPHPWQPPNLQWQNKERRRFPPAPIASPRVTDLTAASGVPAGPPDAPADRERTSYRAGARCPSR